MCYHLLICFVCRVLYNTLAIIMNNYISKKAAGVKSSHIHSQPKARVLTGTSNVTTRAV